MKKHKNLTWDITKHQKSIHLFERFFSIFLPCLARHTSLMVDHIKQGEARLKSQVEKETNLREFVPKGECLPLPSLSPFFHITLFLHSRYRFFFLRPFRNSLVPEERWRDVDGGEPTIAPLPLTRAQECLYVWGLQWCRQEGKDTEEQRGKIERGTQRPKS